MVAESRRHAACYPWMPLCCGIKVDWLLCSHPRPQKLLPSMACEEEKGAYANHNTFCCHGHARPSPRPQPPHLPLLVSGQPSAAATGNEETWKNPDYPGSFQQTNASIMAAFPVGRFWAAASWPRSQLEHALYIAAPNGIAKEILHAECRTKACPGQPCLVRHTRSTSKMEEWSVGSTHRFSASRLTTTYAVCVDFLVPSDRTLL
jgi:hypothetical protein